MPDTKPYPSHASFPAAPPMPDIVISGIGLVTPLGIGVDATWRAILAGECGLRPLSVLEVPEREGPPRPGGEVPGIEPVSLERDARESMLLDLALDEALRSAGLSDQDVRCDGARMGIVLATTLAGMRRAAYVYRGGDERLFETFLAGEIARRLACRAGVTGVVTTVSAACASGLSSICHARALLQSGEVDLVIAGGYDPISEYAYAGFNSLRLVTAGSIRPFHRERDGMQLGEAAALMVLERAGDAERRGHDAYALVAGTGESSDGFHLTRPDPEGGRLTGAIRSALDEAGVTAERIGMISAHATGTPANDAAERTALIGALGDHLAAIPCAAFKAATGHTLGAAGAVELALSAIALRERIVPPTAQLDRDALEFTDVALVGPKPLPMRGDRTIGISLGFGGSNAVTVLAPPRESVRGAAGGNGFARAPATLAITGIGFYGVGTLRSAEELAQHMQGSAARAVNGAAAATDDEAVLDEAHLSRHAGGARVRRLSLYARLMLASARQAIDHALPRADGPPDDPPEALRDAAALLASMHGACAYTHDYYTQLVADGLDAANPLWFAEGVPNVGSAHVSMSLGIRGAAQTIIGSRTGALDALHLARYRAGAAGWSRVLVGAAEEQSDRISRFYAAFNLHASAGRRGFRAGAGSAALMLEPANGTNSAALGHITASAAATAPDRTAAALRCAAARVLSALGEVDAVMTSWNNTWIGLAELRGIGDACAARPIPISTMYGPLPELFAVTPLAAIVSIVQSGMLPPAPPNLPRVRGVRAGREPVPVQSVAIVVTGYDGAARGVRLELPART